MCWGMNSTIGSKIKWTRKNTKASPRGQIGTGANGQIGGVTPERATIMKIKEHLMPTPMYDSLLLARPRGALTLHLLQCSPSCMN